MNHTGYRSIQSHWTTCQSVYMILEAITIVLFIIFSFFSFIELSLTNRNDIYLRHVIWCFFWLDPVACRVFTPQPGMELHPPGGEAWCLHHWTSRDVPVMMLWYKHALWYGHHYQAHYHSHHFTELPFPPFLSLLSISQVNNVLLTVATPLHVVP